MKVKKIDISIFQNRIKLLRTERYSSIDKFCDHFNAVTDTKLSSAAVSRWENGLREPSMSTVMLLADFFCVPVAWLMGTSDVRVESTDEEDTELLDIFHGLSVRDRAKLLTYACELEENEKKDGANK